VMGTRAYTHVGDLVGISIVVKWRLSTKFLVRTKSNGKPNADATEFTFSANLIIMCIEGAA